MQEFIGLAIAMPQRPSANKPNDSKPSDFPVISCEAALPPYAVPIGGDNQFIVFDSANAGGARLPVDDPKSLNYQLQLMTAARPANGLRGGSFFASHHPVLGYETLDDGKLVGGNLPLQDAMAQVNGLAYYTAGIQLARHGHAHNFQALIFASDHPATIISGNGGGKVMTTCSQQGRRLLCDRTGRIAAR